MWQMCYLETACIRVQCAFYAADILTCHSHKNTRVSNNINVPVSHYRVTVSQHAQNLKQLNGIQPSLFIIYICDFPSVTYQNVFREKGLFSKMKNLSRTAGILIMT